MYVLEISLYGWVGGGGGGYELIITLFFINKNSFMSYQYFNTLEQV